MWMIILFLYLLALGLFVHCIIKVLQSIDKKKLKTEAGHPSISQRTIKQGIPRCPKCGLIYNWGCRDIFHL